MINILKGYFHPLLAPLLRHGRLTQYIAKTIPRQETATPPEGEAAFNNLLNKYAL
ncbi:MAG: hypothetical protein AB1815_06860 [Bacillota bacterium]